MKPPGFIITVGEENTVGKEMLRRKLSTLRRCGCCGILFEPTLAEVWECSECEGATDAEKMKFAPMGTPYYGERT
jgi:hypothetical protein